MKECGYCGKSNDENAIRCVECGTEFENIEVTKPSSGTLHQEGPAPVAGDDLVRDRPKFIVVAGFWVLYGTGLLVNIILFLAVWSGGFTESSGVLALILSVGGIVLCSYLLYRVKRNYDIHKQREENAKSEKEE